MYYRLKRFIKSRVHHDSLTWRAALVAGRIVNAPKTVYRRITGSSIFYFESEMDMCSLFPEAILEKTLELFRPASVLDLGCGTGRSLEFFLARGIDAVGVEGSTLAISKSKHADRIVQADLNQPLDLGRRFDMVWSFEVAEHIHPRYTQEFVSSIVRHADRVVMSAAQPGQHGQGHFNEQPPEYWIEIFDERGYAYDAAASDVLQRIDDLFAENMLVFRKRDP